MINYETILSTFDDKLTLLQWLQKVEEALQGAGLERVDITQVTPTTAVFKFTFADGTSLTTPSITLPRGPKGDTGPQGQTGPQGPVGPKGSYEVVELTSTSGTLSDATYNKIETNDVIIDYKVATTHHYLFKISDTSTTTMYGAIQNDTSRMYIFSVTKATKEYTITNKYIEVNETKVQVIPSADVVGKVLTVKNDYTSYWADNTPEGNKVKSTSATSGQVLTADGSGGASWNTLLVEGVDIQSTGVESGKVLSADGDGGVAWDTVGGGVEYVTLTGTSGTLSASDRTKIANGAFVKYNENVHTDYWLYPYFHYDNYYYFSNVRIATTLQNGGCIRADIDATSGSYSVVIVTKGNIITRQNIDSGTATNGQVLKADGNGEANWGSI